MRATIEPTFLFLLTSLFVLAIPFAMILFLPRRRLLGIGLLVFALLGSGFLFVAVATKQASYHPPMSTLSLLDASTPGEPRVQPIDVELHDLQSRVLKQQRALEAIPASFQSEVDASSNFSAVVTEDDVAEAIERAKRKTPNWPGESSDPPSDAVSATFDENGSPRAMEKSNQHTAMPTVDRSNYPVWVNSPPAEVNGKYAIVLESHPFDDRFACEREMKEITQETIRVYAKLMAEDRGMQDVDTRGIRFTRQELKDAAHERFYALRPTSMGDMTILYQLTVIDDAMNEKLIARMENTYVQKRVKVAGVMSTGAVVMLAGLFGVFRFAARNATDPFAS